MISDLSELQRIHIVGIGGAGMSAIARVLHGNGIDVSGSDRDASPVTTALVQEGIPVRIGHKADTLENVDLVLASSAIPENNIELQTALTRGLPVMRRPEFLPILTEKYKVIAVAGAHGKTTVTAMLAWLLTKAGLDPTFIVGGNMENLQTNARCGSGPYFIIEADEYRNTFLGLRPAIAVVTNIEYDHPDFFPDMRQLRWSFGEFVNNIQPDGLLVACHDDAVVHAIAASYHANGGRVKLYGQSQDEVLNWQVRNCHSNNIGGVTFTAIKDGEPQGDIHLRIPGEFNALNALAVLAVASELGISWQTVCQALENFSGTARRFEILGEVHGVTVVDDYAHHPTQIQGVLMAARQRFPGKRIIAVWEPHTYSRIKALFNDFMGAFSAADAVVIMPIYAAREKVDPTLTASLLANNLEHDAVQAVNSLDDAVNVIAELTESGDVVLLMGAGYEYIVGERLLDKIGAG